MGFRDFASACKGGANPAGAGAATVDSGVAGAARAAEVRALLEALPTCVSREMCDALVLSFCLVHSKGARKRMVRPHLPRP